MPIFVKYCRPDCQSKRCGHLSGISRYFVEFGVVVSLTILSIAAEQCGPERISSNHKTCRIV
jgi:hypothetical protein